MEYDRTGVCHSRDGQRRKEDLDTAREVRVLDPNFVAVKKTQSVRNPYRIGIAREDGGAHKPVPLLPICRGERGAQQRCGWPQTTICESFTPRPAAKVPLLPL